MKLKVCGMREAENISQLLELQPDYMGMIFYSKSSRNVADESHAAYVRQLSAVKKVGVFVNAELAFMLAKIRDFGLDLIQLHGSESPAICQQLMNTGCKLIKVFSVGDGFDFVQLKPYEPYVDYFLFDTKGKLPGGNGVVFNWEILKDYPSDIPFFLSGGIGLENVAEISQDKFPKLHAIDVNSRFELSPALKDIELLSQLKKIMQDGQNH